MQFKQISSFTVEKTEAPGEEGICLTSLSELANEMRPSARDPDAKPSDPCSPPPPIVHLLPSQQSYW